MASYASMETGFGLGGALMSGLSAYYAAKSQKRVAAFNEDMAGIQNRIAQMNARFDERTARAILQSGQQAQGQIGLQAGKVKSSQRASQAARGLTMGVGSAAEEIATTDIMAATDKLTIDMDTTRKAWAARMQGVNAEWDGINALNSARMSSAAAPVSPALAGFNTLLSGAQGVSASWLRRTAPRYKGDEFLQRRG